MPLPPQKICTQPPHHHLQQLLPPHCLIRPSRPPHASCKTHPTAARSASPPTPRYWPNLQDRTSRAPRPPIAIEDKTCTTATKQPHCHHHKSSQRRPPKTHSTVKQMRAQQRQRARRGHGLTVKIRRPLGQRPPRTQQPHGGWITTGKAERRRGDGVEKGKRSTVGRRGREPGGRREDPNTRLREKGEERV